MLTKVTLHVPLIDAETLEACGVKQQDFVDDLSTVARLWCGKMALEFKDAAYRGLAEQAKAHTPDAELPDSLLPGPVREVFGRFDAVLGELARVCHDEARRQQRVRHKQRDREDGVLRAIEERERHDRRHRKEQAHASR